MMKQALLLFALVAAAPVFGSWAGGLKVRFGVGLFGGYFMTMPRSIAEAKTHRWHQVSRPEGPLKSLIMYCPADYIFCVLFDQTEYIAGIQVAIPHEKYINSKWDWEERGFTRWTPPGSANSYWTIQQYFVDEKILATDVNERLAALDRSKTIQSGKIWLAGPGGKLMEVSTNEKDISGTFFTEQACVPLMGRHYYYNMTVLTECTAAGIYPWFPLAASGEIIGMGLVTAGQLPEKLMETDYFERPDKSAVQMIVPRGPQCLYNLGDNPGLVTMHIYYIKNPLLLTCILQ